MPQLLWGAQKSGGEHKIRAIGGQNERRGADLEGMEDKKTRYEVLGR